MKTCSALVRLAKLRSRSYHRTRALLVFDRKRPRGRPRTALIRSEQVVAGKVYMDGFLWIGASNDLLGQIQSGPALDGLLQYRFKNLMVNGQRIFPDIAFHSCWLSPSAIPLPCVQSHPAIH